MANLGTLRYNVVLSTKYRVKAFNTQKRKAGMQTVLNELSKTSDLKIEKAVIAEDSLNLLISFKPRISLSNAIKNIKGYSARNWFKLFPVAKEECYQGHLWAQDYYYATLDTNDKTKVTHYFKQQELTDYRRKHLRKVNSQFAIE